MKIGDWKVKAKIGSKEKTGFLFFELSNGRTIFSFHLIDLVNIWKVHRVNYKLEILQRSRRRFWFNYWTPVWHEGRGPYITLGLGLIAFYRGY